MISIDSHTYEKKRARILSDIRFYSDTLALNEGTPNEVAIRVHLKAAQNALQRLEHTASSVRSDIGKRHKKTQRGWRTQAEVAADFSKQAKKIGGRWYGKMTVGKVKDWESRYPNEMKREPKSGYHAGLRNTANPTSEIKTAYYNAAADWNEYWRLHNEAFSKWLKANPKGDHALFLNAWERPGKTVHRSDTDKTKRYGADTSFADSLDDGRMDGDED